MQRKKKLFLNTAMAIVNQAVIFISGFIVPKLIILHYGSATNGLVSSIAQYLAMFSMMEMGVGAVVKVALYEPLAKKDNDQISRVLISSKRFFRKIGNLLYLYSIGLVIYFIICVNHSQGYLATIVLVGAMAFSSIVNYLWGIIYQQLLNADQCSYIPLGIDALTTILNTVLSVLLIQCGVSIEWVKLLSAMIILIRPLLLKIYVDKHYQLNFGLELDREPLTQKWNGLAQHIAVYITNHADTVILTIFSTLENVSIYYVYHLVMNGLRQCINILTTGVQALLGNMYARNEKENLQNTFDVFEWGMHVFVTLVYSIAFVMIIPFIKVYMAGVTDADYVNSLFAALLVMATAMWCLRTPYNIMVLAVGHFKQTQNSSIIEALLNISISVVLVKQFGLVGVAIGTFIAMLYRTCYLVWYLKNNILYRPLSIAFRHGCLDFLTAFLIIVATSKITLSDVSWGAWIIMGLQVGLIAIVVVFIINILFNRHLIIKGVNKIYTKK